MPSKAQVCDRNHAALLAVSIPTAETPLMNVPVWFSDTSRLAKMDMEIWQRLVTSVTEPNSGWRLPVLATPDAETRFRQRIVVLRSVDADHRTLFAHTDRRSPKITALQLNPAAEWLFYDSTNQVQLQLSGDIDIHVDDEVADAMWQSQPESSLRGYLAPLTPGTRREAPERNLPDDVRTRIPDRSELEAGRQNFAVISCEINFAELLLLRRDGNLRATFSYGTGGTTANWIAP